MSTQPLHHPWLPSRNRSPLPSQGLCFLSPLPLSHLPAIPLNHLPQKTTPVSLFHCLPDMPSYCPSTHTHTILSLRHTVLAAGLLGGKQLIPSPANTRGLTQTHSPTDLAHECAVMESTC